ncbi:MAG: hypothetical protein JST53_18075 [Actinobacteria bacterium]|nr:hypothetical protein [Actinomycetota bacterium]
MFAWGHLGDGRGGGRGGVGDPGGSGGPRPGAGPRRAAAASFFAAVVRANRWDLHALSSTISAAYVGAGRVSAYACFYVTSVHTAAGLLLAREAGALVTDVEGGRWTLDSDSLLIAATVGVHADLLALG